MALFLVILFAICAINNASDGEDSAESCLTLADYTSATGSCLSYYSEESLQESESDLIAGAISLDEFISIHHDIANQFYHFEGAIAVRWNLFRHCMRVIVERNLVQDVSFNAGMRRFVGLISWVQLSYRRSRRHAIYQMITTSELIQFADDINSFVLQTGDAYFVTKFKRALLVVVAMLNETIDSVRSVDLEMRERMDRIFGEMDAAEPGTQSYDKLKDLYIAICCHFVHRPKMSTDVVLTAVQHQRMIDFIADHGSIRDCQLFVRILQRRKKSFFPHPAIIKMMKRILEESSNLSKEKLELLHWVTKAVADAKINPTKLIMW